MTKQPARIQVKETKRYWGDFDCSLESIIASLQADLDEGWQGIETDYERDYGDCDTHEVYYLYKHRPARLILLQLLHQTHFPRFGFSLCMHISALCNLYYG